MSQNDQRCTPSVYNVEMQKKIFWATWTLLGFLSYALPFWWALAATIPLGILSWWFAYRSGWF